MQRDGRKGVPLFCNPRVFSHLGLVGAARFVVQSCANGAGVFKMSENQEENLNMERNQKDQSDESRFLSRCAHNHEERLEKSFTNEKL